MLEEEGEQHERHGRSSLENELHSGEELKREKAESGMQEGTVTESGIGRDVRNERERKEAYYVEDLERWHGRSTLEQVSIRALERHARLSAPDLNAHAGRVRNNLVVQGRRLGRRRTRRAGRKE